MTAVTTVGAGSRWFQWSALAGSHQPGELRTALHAELAEHVAQVVLDRLGAHEQRRRRLAVGEALGDELGDPKLVCRQLRGVAWRARVMAPAARSSRRARSANGSASMRSNAAERLRSSSRASSRRSVARRYSP